MSITELPSADNIPEAGIGKRTTFLYGEKKIGKTTFASQAPNSIILATEKGYSHIRARVINISNWTEFAEAYVLLKKTEHDRKTVVIDTIDNLYKFCLEHTLNQYGYKSGGEDNNQGYAQTNAALFKWLTKMSLLPDMGMILIGHSQEKEVKTRTGKSVKIVPTLSAGAARIVTGMVDYILYADVEEIITDDGAIQGYRHVIHTKPTTIYEAGTRIGPDDPELPEVLPLNYMAFEKALRGEELTEEDWLTPQKRKANKQN